MAKRIKLENTPLEDLKSHIHQKIALGSDDIIEINQLPEFINKTIPAIAKILKIDPVAIRPRGTRDYEFIIDLFRLLSEKEKDRLSALYSLELLNCTTEIDTCWLDGNVYNIKVDLWNRINLTFLKTEFKDTCQFTKCDDKLEIKVIDDSLISKYESYKVHSKNMALTQKNYEKLLLTFCTNAIYKKFIGKNSYLSTMREYDILKIICTKHNWILCEKHHKNAYYECYGGYDECDHIYIELDNIPYQDLYDLIDAKHMANFVYVFVKAFGNFDFTKRCKIYDYYLYPYCIKIIPKDDSITIKIHSFHQKLTEENKTLVRDFLSHHQKVTVVEDTDTAYIVTIPVTIESFYR